MSGGEDRGAPADRPGEPRGRSPVEAIDTLPPAVAGLAVATIALLASAPGIGPLDAGDFVTAAATLGVPHPTGFAPTVMLERVAMWAPWGTLAARAAWASALAAGVAAACGVALLPGRSARWAAAAAMATVFAVATPLALAARVPEAYMLHLALVAATLVGVARLASTGDLRWAAIAGLAAGLGVANHAVFRLFALALFPAMLAAAPRGTRRRAAALGLAMGTLAQPAWLYLGAAALGGSLHNWGDPSSPAALWAHMQASSVRAAFADELGATPALVAVRGVEAARQLWAGLGVLMIAAPVGALLWGRRSPAVGVGLVGVVLLDLGYAAAINPMGLRDWQNLQVATWGLALLAAVAVAAAVDAMARLRGVRGGLAAAASAVVIVAIAPHAAPAPAGLARDWSMEDLVAAHTATAAPRSVTTTVSDSVSGAAIYAQLVLDARPDSVVIARGTFSTPSTAAEQLARAPFDALGPLRGAPLPARERSLPAFTGALLTSSIGHREVWWEVGGMITDLPAGVALEHRWPLGRVVRSEVRDAAWECEGTRSLCRSADAVEAAGARAEAGVAGVWYRRWVVAQLVWRGARAFRAGSFEEAASLFARAVEIDPATVGARNSLAAARASLGDVEGALRLTNDALALDPASETALTNAARFARALGREGEAVEFEARLRRLGLAR